MWAAFAQAVTIAFVALVSSQSLAEPIDWAPRQHAIALSPELGTDPEGKGPSDPVRLAAIDPLRPSSSTLLSRSSEPFGFIALQAPEGGLWRKWRDVQRDIRMEATIMAACRASPDECPSAPARRFLAMIEAARGRQGRARLGEINRAINLSIRPMSDLAQYGVVDLWTSPLATLAAGAGDCEDYAIAKYVALQEIGVSDEDLRLLIVRDARLGEDHAVVAARLDGRWLVLDNRRLVLLEDEQLNQYAPMFEIDGGGVKRLVAAGTPRSMSSDEPSARSAASGPASGAY
jgi:predicted transglutaminase-like cysteine proteinase